MNSYRLLVVVLLTYVPASRLHAQQEDTFHAVTWKLDQYLASAVKAGKFNGAALVVQKGTILLQKGYGFKEVADKRMNDPQSVFMIGSVTKSFTSTVILQLQEQGKLSVEDQLDKYFPDFPKGNTVRLKHLLSHTSGIYNYTNEIGPEDSAIVGNPVPQQRILDIIYQKSRSFTPGAKYSYCNSGYFLLGLIIEKVTGKRYDQAVRDMILTPLGMTHSGFDFMHLTSNDKTTGYEVLNDTKQVKAHLWDSTVSYAAGSIYSTVGDLYKWTTAVGAGQLLSKNSWQQAFTPVLNHYGYGWWIDSLFGRKYITHSGGLPGFMSNLIYFPDEDVSIILLNNEGNYGESLVTINRSLCDILFNKVSLTWETRKEIKIAPAVQQQYTGVYAFEKSQLFITLKNGRFEVKGGVNTDLPKLLLYAESENKFFLKEVDIQFEFIRDPNNKVTKLLLYQDGHHFTWEKIK